MSKQINLSLLFLIAIIFSQNNFVTGQNYYQRLYGDTCFDVGYSIYLDKDSSLIMTGYTCSYYNASNDVYLIHTGLNGGLIWSQSIDILGEDQGYSVIENFDDQGNPIYIVTGDTRGYHLPSYSDAFLMQTDQNGVPVWVETFSPDIKNDHGRCVIRTTDKNYLVAGYSNTCDTTTGDACQNCNDVFLFKTDYSGTLLWAKYIDIAGGDDQAFKVIETNKKYYVTGYTRTTNCPNTDMFIMQVDPNGTVDWVKTYGDTLDDFSYSIKATPDSGLIIVGHTYNYSPTTVPDIHVIKTNLNGVPQWKTTYNSNNNGQKNFGRDIVVTQQGYYITGYSDVISPASYDMHLIKITPTGNMLWQRAYGGNRDEQSYSLINLNNGVAQLGYTFTYGSGLDDVYLVRTNSIGNSCEQLMDTNYEYIDTLFHTPHFTVDTEYIYSPLEVSYVSPMNVDSLCYDTAHHSPRMGMIQFKDDLIKFYPNPIGSNDIGKIEVLMTESQSCRVELSDQLGRQLKTFENKSSQNFHEFILDTEGLENGIYILKINGYLVKQIIISQSY